MQISISLAEIFRNAFGFQPNPFLGKFGNIRGDGKAGSPGTKDMGKHGSLYYQDNNPLIYLPVQVEVGDDPIPATPDTTYAEKFAGANYKKGKATTWWLPNPVTSCDIKVHIIDTELTERDGMVSEGINISGYKINVKGLLVNENANEFPEKDYDTLLRLVNLKTPFKINNPATDIILMNGGNNTKMVTVRGLRFPGKEGVKHVKAYELELESDLPFNLIDIS